MTATLAQNVITDIDDSTGAVTVDEASIFSALGEVRLICPSVHGGRTGRRTPTVPHGYVVLSPAQRLHARLDHDRRGRVPPHLRDLRRLRTLGRIHAISASTGKDDFGRIHAISASTGRTEWLYEQRASMTSLVATGGGLLFGGDANGRFMALDQRTGEMLWKVNLGSPVTGLPMIYTAGGRQYVAVSTGSLIVKRLSILTPDWSGPLRSDSFRRPI